MDPYAFWRSRAPRPIAPRIELPEDTNLRLVKEGELVRVIEWKFSGGTSLDELEAVLAHPAAAHTELLLLSAHARPTDVPGLERVLSRLGEIRLAPQIFAAVDAWAEALAPVTRFRIVFNPRHPSVPFLSRLRARGLRNADLHVVVNTLCLGGSRGLHPESDRADARGVLENLDGVRKEARQVTFAARNCSLEEAAWLVAAFPDALRGGGVLMHEASVGHTSVFTCDGGDSREYLTFYADGVVLADARTATAFWSSNDAATFTVAARTYEWVPDIAREIRARAAHLEGP